jgi:protein SCO1/2
VSMWTVSLFAMALLALPTPGWAHDSLPNQRLPTIGEAPAFALTSQDGARVTLADFRDKVLAISFVYTSCADVCPLLTAKMAQVQDELGADFGSRIVFASITVDPERDTPEVLKQYARNFGANLAGWVFLTGTPESIREVTRRYGIYVTKTAGGDFDHTLLTSLIDRHGALRVQYLGVRFDPEEFRRDLLSLLDEPE